MGPRHVPRRWPVQASLALALLCLLADPGRGQSGFPSRGRVVALDGATGTVTLDHDTIPGLTLARRTEFPVRHLGLLAGLRIGDEVRFSIEASQESHGILTVAELRVEPADPIQERTRSRAWWPPSLSGAPALLLGGAAALLLGALMYVLARRELATRTELRRLAENQEALQDGLEQMTRALAQLGEAIRRRHAMGLRQRLAAVRAAAGGLSPEPGVERRGSHVLILKRGARDRPTSGDGRAVPGTIRVVLDRRFAERRSASHLVAPDRRRGERRRPPPPTWVTSGFDLVRLPAPAPPKGVAGGDS